MDETFSILCIISFEGNFHLGRYMTRPGFLSTFYLWSDLLLNFHLFMTAVHNWRRPNQICTMANYFVKILHRILKNKILGRFGKHFVDFEDFSRIMELMVWYNQFSLPSRNILLHKVINFVYLIKKFCKDFWDFGRCCTGFWQHDYPSDLPLYTLKEVLKIKF